jgi:hypothetical protein
VVNRKGKASLGSQDSDRDFSDYLRFPLQLEGYLTALVSPSNDDPKN